MSARKEEVIAAFERFLRPVDCKLNAEVTERMVVAFACTRLSERITKEMFAEAFKLPPVMKFNQLGSDVPASEVRPESDHNSDDWLENMEDASLGDIEDVSFSLAKLYFCVELRDEDVANEDFHGKALLVRACLKVASRLLDAYAVKVNLTKEKVDDSFKRLTKEKKALEAKLEEMNGGVSADKFKQVEKQVADLTAKLQVEIESREGLELTMQQLQNALEVAQRERESLELANEGLTAALHSTSEDEKKEEEFAGKVAALKKEYEAKLARERAQKDTYFLIAQDAKKEMAELERTVLELQNQKATQKRGPAGESCHDAECE